jgi:hypothetical protein
MPGLKNIVICLNYQGATQGLPPDNNLCLQIYIRLLLAGLNADLHFLTVSQDNQAQFLT